MSRSAAGGWFSLKLLFTPPLQRGALGELRNWKPFERFPIYCGPLPPG